MSQLSASFIETHRHQFPALARHIDDRPVVFLDGPAGTQVPQRVIHAVTRYYSECNANHGGEFSTSQQSDQWVDEAHLAFAQFLGASDPGEIAFGQNMTSLTFALSRSLGRTWNPGDEVLVTRLDHDANVSPWVMAAQDAGASVQFVEINREDCTLDMSDFYSKLSDKTKLVAVGAASNSVGTINPVREITQAAHQHDALVFVDAVHYAPHARINVKEWGCDFLSCSAYKFFGPHVGLMWGRRELLESLPAYKVRPACNSLPSKWMTGTQSHESIVGGLAAIDYLADLGRDAVDDATLDRPEAWDAAFQEIQAYEQQLSAQLLTGLQAIPAIKVWGIDDVDRVSERFPTFSITHESLSPVEVSKRLGERGIFAWHGHYYALELSEVLGREPDGMVRLGMVHYNLPHEVDLTVQALSELG